MSALIKGDPDSDFTDLVDAIIMLVRLGRLSSWKETVMIEKKRTHDRDGVVALMKVSFLRRQCHGSCSSDWL